MGDFLKQAMRGIASGLEIPIVIFLLLLSIFTVLQIGIIIAEYYYERRTLTAKIPKLLDDIQDENKNLEETINKSGILKRQKMVLLEVMHHPNLTENTIDALAIRKLEEEQNYYDIRLKSSDMVARLGPMLGLLGTLIPLGPGIVALSRGDVDTLSLALSTAFDTTILGLICAAFAFVISAIRKMWYGNYMSMLEAAMEGVLEVIKDEKEK